MIETIKNFNKQFEYEPKIQNEDKLKKYSKFIVVGMGGSHLAAGLLKIWNPSIDLIIHNNYGLPQVSEETLKESLIILSSYSGNTEEAIDAEETIDVYEHMIKKRLSFAVISTGGKLIELAKEHSAPYIQMPDTDIQPRNALGYSLKALLKIMGQEDAFKEVNELVNILNPSDYEKSGKELAEKLKNKVPIIYSSARNMPVAYTWKIKFNETGKIPAFYNVLPELNHNEMQGFDVTESTKDLSKNFHFIFLHDEKDNPRILKRMDILQGLYEDRGLPVEVIEMNGNTIFHKIFSSLILADWVAYHTAKQYGLDPKQVPMIEEFKKLISTS